MIILCFTIKRYLESITEEMDKRHIRLLNTIASFDKRYKERQLCEDKTQHLRDFLNYPSHFYEEVLINNAHQYF